MKTYLVNYNIPSYIESNMCGVYEFEIHQTPKECFEYIEKDLRSKHLAEARCDGFDDIIICITSMSIIS